MPRREQRVFIVRIGRSVRFALADDGVLATAIWERLPHYGHAERTRDGLLALALGLPPSLTLPTESRPSGPGSLRYCLLTRRLVFPAAMAPAADAAVVPWAELSELYPPHALVAVAHGARISLLHADS